MTTTDARLTDAWVALMGALARYHRFEVKRMGPLLAPGARLIVGYHGRPLGLDLCMLTAAMYRHQGYLTHGIIHGYFHHTPALRRLIDALGFVPGDGPYLAEAIARGEKVIVGPGGTREGCRSFRHRYEVDWGGRLGYLRLAIRHQLPIVPVATAGIDDVYIGFNDGYALGRRLGVQHALPVWLGVGVGGLWPFALPFPVKLTMHVGDPITEHLACDARDEASLRRADGQVRGAVQALLDDGRREVAQRGAQCVAHAG